MTEIFAVRILYMEDDPGLSRLMQKNLQRRGYIVDLAANGEEGLSMLERSSYDLILLDYNMPFCGGIDVIRALSGKGAVPPAIMVTAEGNVDVAVEALKLGASDYIVKDTEMKYLELLPVVIDQVLEKQRFLNEKQQMFQAIQESEERYRHLFEVNPLPMWVSDRDTRDFLEVNPAAVEHYGWSRDEFLTMKIDDVLLSDGAAVPAEGGGSSGPGTLRPVTVRHCKKNGEVIEAEIIAHAMTFAGRSAEVVLANDITERKRREEERIRAQKLESLGNLAGGLAHDFNNILTAILGNISIAKMDTLAGKNVYDRLEESEKASLRARDLTYQFLTFSKGGAPVKKTIALAHAVREAAGFALRGARSRAEFMIPDGLSAVDADEEQLRQVIGNIVTNADQSMPDGGVIRVIAETIALGPDNGMDLAPGVYVKIAITDQGVGIPPEIREKIFDPYFTTRKKASGLGLATSYSIIKRHNGVMTVESSPGGGSTFSIFLPASEQETERQDRPAAGAPPGRSRILVMDDEAMVRDVAGMVLSNLGYEVGFARDGAEAIDLYDEARKSGRPFDVVIMDLTIPGGMGGREAIGKLRQIDPAVKAIVSSGYSNDPVMAEFSEYGFSGVVPKPYTVQRLREAVEKVMEH